MKIKKLNKIRNAQQSYNDPADTVVTRGYHLNQVIDKVNEITEEINGPTGIMNSVAHVYYYVSHSGDDDSGNGTEGQPYRTIAKAIKNFPKNMIQKSLYLVLGAGSWKLSELITAGKATDNSLYILGTVEEYLTIEGVTYNNDYTFSTSTTLTTDELKGKFLARSYAAQLGWQRGVPILENTTNVFKAPYLGPTTGNLTVYHSVTNIEVDITYIVNLNRTNFVWLNFINNLGTRFEFWASWLTGFYYCHFSSPTASYEMLSMRYGWESYMTGCYFEINPTSTSGEILDIWEFNKLWLSGCIFSNVETTVPQGVDFKGGKYSQIDSCLFKGLSYAVKIEGGEHYFAGNFAEDCTALLYIEEFKYARIEESDAYLTTDMRLDNTPNLIAEGNTTNGGRIIKLPNMVITLGGGAFSSTYTNLTADFAYEQHIQVGAGAMVYSIDGTLV